MKTTAFTVLGIVLGIVVGAGGMHQWLMPQLIALDYKLGEADQALAVRQSGSGDAARLARLEAERQAYDETLRDLRSKLDSLQDSRNVAVPTAEAASVGSPMEGVSDDVPEPPREARRERGRRGDREGTAEERETRRQEFVAQLQANLTDFFTGELEKSVTPEVQERLVALETQVHDMMDIRRQMRNVESDAERDALRQSFGESMNAAEGIMKEQQRDMINAIAGQFNIRGKDDKAAFRQAVQTAVDSPFFSDNPAALLWGGGRPSGYGGPGRRR